MLPRRIATERLLLRSPAPEDAVAIFESYAQDPEVTRYLSWRPSTELSESESHVRDRMRAWRRGNVCAWSIVKAQDARYIGMIEMRLKGHLADVGYVLTRQEWGKGYMTEALRAVIAAGFKQPEVYRIAAFCDLKNPASARVMEKAGMAREGVLRRYFVFPNLSEEPRDVYSYAITR